MAQLISPQKTDLSKINGGYKYQDNSVLTADAVNEMASGVAFAQTPWDFIFTDLQELVSQINTIKGNVLVKGISITQNLIFPQNISSITSKVIFVDCVLKEGFSINLNSWSMSGLYCEKNTKVFDGYIVSDCKGCAIYSGAKILFNCQAFGAEACIRVFGITIDYTAVQPEKVIFSDCTFISDIEFYVDELIFTSCHNLSRIFGSNVTYQDCSYVDPFTCEGFVKGEDVGKIPLLSNDGSFATYDLNADEQMLKMINDGGVE